MIGFLTRLIRWIPLNIVTVLGVVQAAIKLFKEIITGVINIVFPFTPDGGKFEKFVLKARSFIEKADAIVEKIKGYLLKYAVGV